MTNILYTYNIQQYKAAGFSYKHWHFFCNKLIVDLQVKYTMDEFYNNSVYICFFILQQFHFHIGTEYEIHPQSHSQ